MQRTLHWILLVVLIFHIGLTLLGLYTFFIDSYENNRYQLYPLSLLLYSIIWFGIFKRKKPFVYIYFFLCLLELGFKVLPPLSGWKDVLGEVLFPANLLFLGLIVITWNNIFSTNES